MRYACSRSPRLLLTTSIAETTGHGRAAQTGGCRDGRPQRRARPGRRGGRQGWRRRARGARAHRAQAPSQKRGLSAMADEQAPAPAPDERKANRRGAARLAAVQALYQMDIAGTGVNDIMAEFETHWI